MHVISTTIRTESLRSAVSVAGKRDFRARDKCVATGTEIQLINCRDRAVARKPAKSRLYGRRQEISANLRLPGGPGRIRTSNQTVMSGRKSVACVDFPGDSTRSNVFVASRCDRFWCGTGAVIATCLRGARLSDGCCGRVVGSGRKCGSLAVRRSPRDGPLPGTTVAGARIRQSHHPRYRLVRAARFAR